MTTITLRTAAPPLTRLADRIAEAARHAYVASVVRPASPAPLACLRLSFAVILLVQAVLLSTALLETHGSQAVLQSPELIGDSTWLPNLLWLTEPLRAKGAAEFLVIRLVYAGYLSGLLGLLLGWHTRVAAALAWATHALLFPSWHISSYGVDQFATIVLFYLLVMPVGHAWSLDALSGRVKTAPSSAARLSLTVLRLHLCAVYLSSGVIKATGEQWRNGEAIWRSVMQPQFATFDLSWLAALPWIAVLMCWSTLAIEIGYSLFVWPRATRRWWVLATVGLHLGIGLLMGIWLFAAAMIALTVSAFGLAAGPPPKKDRGAPLREPQALTT